MSVSRSARPHASRARLQAAPAHEGDLLLRQRRGARVEHVAHRACKQTTSHALQARLQLASANAHRRHSTPSQSTSIHGRRRSRNSARRWDLSTPESEQRRTRVSDACAAAKPAPLRARLQHLNLVPYLVVALLLRSGAQRACFSAAHAAHKGCSAWSPMRCARAPAASTARTRSSCARRSARAAPH